MNNETRDEFILEKALLGFKTQALGLNNTYITSYAWTIYDIANTPFKKNDKEVNEDTLVHYILHSPLHWIFAADNRLEYQWYDQVLLWL